MAKHTKIKQLADEMHRQALWMARCGGTLAGYIRNYGTLGEYVDLTFVRTRETMTVPAWSGNGGAAIYEADRARMVTLASEFQYRAATAEHRNGKQWVARTLRGA